LQQHTSLTLLGQHPGQEMPVPVNLLPGTLERVFSLQAVVVVVFLVETVAGPTQQTVLFFRAVQQLPIIVIFVEPQTLQAVK
jgi:hypothetical protein